MNKQRHWACIKRYIWHFLLLFLAALIVFAVDIKVKFLHVSHVSFTVLCIIFATLLILFLLHAFSTKNSFKSRAIGAGDDIVMYLAVFFSIFFFGNVYPFPNGEDFDRLVIFWFSFSVLMACICYLIIRLVHPKDKLQNVDKKATLTFSYLYSHELTDSELSGFCYMEINASKEAEEAVDRKPIEALLETMIVNSLSTEKTVIGVTGPWGVGKTYSTKKVLEQIQKDHTQVRVMDDVSCWKFGDEQSVLRGLIEGIISKLDIGFSEWQVNRYVNRCLSKVFDMKNVPISTGFNEDGEEDAVTKQVNDYLLKNKLHLLVLVDDFDRTEAKQILFVYRAVSSMLNFTNVTYVLCFDEQRVSEAFHSLGLSYDYLAKILSLTVHIQMPSLVEMSEKYYQCLLHFLNASQRYKKQSDVSELRLIADDCARYCLTIREFELFVNRIWYLALSASPIDFFDDLRLALLHLMAPLVWQEIKNNYSHFVRDNTLSDRFVNWHPEYRDPDPDKDDPYFLRFESVFGTNYNQLIYEIFPNIGRKLKTKNFVENETEKEKRIHLPSANNDYYFSLFFTQCDNVYKKALTQIEDIYKKPTNYIASALEPFPSKFGAEGMACLSEFLSNRTEDYGLFETITWLSKNGNYWGASSVYVRVDIFLDCFSHLSSEADKERIVDNLASNYDSLFPFISALNYEFSLGKPEYVKISSYFKKVFQKTSNQIARVDPNHFVCNPFSPQKCYFYLHHLSHMASCFGHVDPKYICRLLLLLCNPCIHDSAYSGPKMRMNVTLSAQAVSSFQKKIKAAFKKVNKPTPAQQTMQKLFGDAITNPTGSATDNVYLLPDYSDL